MVTTGEGGRRCKLDPAPTDLALALQKMVGACRSATARCKGEELKYLSRANY
jgi:hypothetical protein